MTQNLKAPKLRFPGFTEDWELRKFSELYNKSSEKNDGSINIDKNITVATMQFKPDITVSSEDYLKTYYTFKVGDIAFEGHHSKDFMFGRFVENDIGDGIVSHIFAVFRPIEDYDLYYWKYAIHNESIMRPVLSKSTKASTMMHDLVTNDFLNESILVPSLDEQKKIGAYLNNLDNLITLHQRKFETLKKLKKGFLQKMFPKNGESVPEIRFPGFTDDWEQRKFDEVFLSFANKNYQLQSTEYCESGKYPIIDQGKKAIIGYSNDSSKVCENYPSIIFGDHTTELKYVDFPFIIGADGVKTLSVKEGNTLFQYYNLLVNNVRPTGYNRHFSMLKEISVFVPSDVEEQTKIGSYFRNLDNLITLHQRKLDILKKLKQGMLQQMFI